MFQKIVHAGNCAEIGRAVQSFQADTLDWAVIGTSFKAQFVFQLLLPFCLGQLITISAVARSLIRFVLSSLVFYFSNLLFNLYS